MKKVNNMGVQQAHVISQLDWECISTTQETTSSKQLGITPEPPNNINPLAQWQHKQQ